MWDFAKANPGTTLLIIWVLAWAAVQPFRYLFLAFNRSLRSRNIAQHGWPTAPIDADGSVVRPEKTTA